MERQMIAIARKWDGNSQTYGQLLFRDPARRRDDAIVLSVAIHVHIQQLKGLDLPLVQGSSIIVCRA
jgi:hypothetical protein